MQSDGPWQRLLDLLRPADGSGPSPWLLAAVGLLALFVLLGVLGRLGRVLIGRRRKADDWDRELAIGLDACPLPAGAPGDRRLTVYHLPARLRLVVVAPAGKDGEVDALAVEKLLDRVLPGLGEVAARDRPFIRVWPAQKSHTGFAAAFHRHTPKAAGRGELSRWVLVAGRAQVGHPGVLLGLGLWADEPTTLDRATLEPHQWLDVLRVREAL